MIARTIICALAALVAFSISGKQAQAEPVDAATKVAVESAVTQSVRDFFGGMSTATCEDVSPITRLEADNTIFVLTDEVVRLSADDVKEGTKYLTCNWVKHEGVLDSVLVDVLAPGAATAAWTYHETVTQKDGVVRKTQGAVLQVWVLDGKDWKIAATKSTEKPQAKAKD